MTSGLSSDLSGLGKHIVRKGAVLRTIEVREEIRHRLARVASAQEAIRSIYELLKKENRKISMAYLCAKAAIPSKGYLSDVMSGRRQLRPEYARPLAKAFGLDRFETKVFVALVQLEHRKSGEHEKLAEELRSWRKVLGVERRKVDENVGQSPRWLAKLFASLPLLGPLPKISDVTSFMSAHDETEIRLGLAELVRMGLVRLDGETVSIEHEQIAFQPKEVNSFQIEFLRDALREAIEQVPVWYKQGSASYFESSLLTTKRSVLVQRLPEIRDFFERLQSDLETGDADELVSLNIQIYPLRRE